MTFVAGNVTRSQGLQLPESAYSGGGNLGLTDLWFPSYRRQLLTLKQECCMFAFHT